LGQENEDLKNKLETVQTSLEANKDIMLAMLSDIPDQSGIISSLKNHSDMIENSNKFIQNRNEELVAQ
jgi:galactokinase/mevalonate kinase-like predicted kinase